MDLPNILNHISIGVADFNRSARFYDGVMATIGARRIHEIPGVTIAYGKSFPEFWIGQPLDGGAAAAGNGTHIAVHANSIDAVQDFFRTAIELGATPDGDPGPRPQYGPKYYGCFVRDPDGHKIEATAILLE